MEMERRRGLFTIMKIKFINVKKNEKKKQQQTKQHIEEMEWKRLTDDKSNDKR